MAGRHSFAELLTRMSLSAQCSVLSAQLQAETEAQRFGEEIDLVEVRLALKLSQAEIGQTM